MFDLDFHIVAGQTPRVSVSIPKAHFELPTHSIEDVVSLDVAFHGLPSDLSSSTASSSANEISIHTHLNNLTNIGRFAAPPYGTGIYERHRKQTSKQYR